MLESEVLNLQAALEEKESALAEQDESCSSSEYSSAAGKRGGRGKSSELRQALEENLRCQEEIKSLIALTKSLEAKLKAENEMHEQDNLCYEEQLAALGCRLEELEAESCSICASHGNSYPSYEGEVDMLRASLAVKAQNNEELSEELYRSRMDVNSLLHEVDGLKQ